MSERWPKRTWVEVDPESGFGIQNLPFGTLSVGEDGEPEVAVRIGEFALRLNPLAEEGLLPESALGALNVGDLADDPTLLPDLRRRVAKLLSGEDGRLRDGKKLRDEALIPLDDVWMEAPMPVLSFVDFYSGIHHASNVGRMFRPDQPPLLPNYRHLPVAYNGRASSVILSEEDVIRPHGQFMPAGAEVPVFAPTRELDFELEFGYFLRGGNELGAPIPVGEAMPHVVGFVLVNDWSARDVQRWEYQPLGPFLAKSFATQISQWLVLPEALASFRIDGDPQDPEPLPHLARPALSHYNLELEVSLQTDAMTAPQVISRSSTRHAYWSPAQQIAHMTSNGCNLETGDLVATGTLSGPEPGTFGSLLELTWRGRDPITLEETGETRTFLEDGDTVILRGWGQGNGYRVELGEVVGKVSS